MKITAVRCFDVHELVAKLRKVTMLTDRSVFPYKNASIQVTDVRADQLSPAQCYVLRSEFEKVSDLRWELLKRGVDLLRLADRRLQGQDLVETGGVPLGYLEFDLDMEPDGPIEPSNGPRLSDEIGPSGDATSSGKKTMELLPMVTKHRQTVTLLPPIVEVQAEANGVTHRIINDGIHRCYLARICHTIPAVVLITGVPADMPYYAYPNADGWTDVRMMESLAPDFIKKHRRLPRPLDKTLYRDFNSSFTNVGGPRGHN